MAVPMCRAISDDFVRGRQENVYINEWAYGPRWVWSGARLTGFLFGKRDISLFFVSSWGFRISS